MSVRAPRASRLALIGLGLALAMGCGRGEERGAPPPPEVTVAAAVEGSVPDRRQYVGNVQAVNSVDVRARVRGYLTARLFDEGATVAEGEVLFKIETRPYEVALAEAKGSLARARADAVVAQREYERAKDLVAKNVVSDSVLDERRAQRDATAAQVEAARAAADAAELNLSYCTVRAPLAGRIGQALVDVGNLVGESGQDTVLARIVQVDPIYVYFAPTERDRLDVLRGVREGRIPERREGLPVEVELGDGSPYPHEGVVDYVDPTVDPTRGTVTVRARVPNPEGQLKPGEFARVVVVFPPITNAVLVPQRAVLDQQGGSYVLVVKDDDSVEIRPVTLGAAHAGLQQIASGLAAGERVVVDGLMKARPGAKVVPKAAPASAPGEPPSAGAPPQPSPPSNRSRSAASAPGPGA